MLLFTRNGTTPTGFVYQLIEKFQIQAKCLKGKSMLASLSYSHNSPIPKCLSHQNMNSLSKRVCAVNDFKSTTQIKDKIIYAVASQVTNSIMTHFGMSKINKVIFFN